MIEHDLSFWILNFETQILEQKRNIEKLSKDQGLDMTVCETAEFCHVFFYICFGLQNQLPAKLLPQVKSVSVFIENIHHTQKKLAVTAGTVMLLNKSSMDNLLNDMVEGFKIALKKIFPTYIIT